MHDISLPISMLMTGAMLLGVALEPARWGRAGRAAALILPLAGLVFFLSRMIWDFKILVPFSETAVLAIGWIGFAMTAVALVLLLRKELRRPDANGIVPPR